MKKIILVSFSALVLITSCKKTTTIQPNQTVETSTVSSEQKVEIESFLNTYYSAKENVLVDKSEASSVSTFFSDNSEAYKCVQHIDKIRLVRKNKGLIYNHLNHSITLSNVVVLSENAYKCTVNENVKYSITGLNVKPEAARLFEVVVIKKNGNYLIQQETDVELEAILKQQDATDADTSGITSGDAAFEKAAYNKAYGKWYAQEWWNRKNPSYYYFTQGNCTNFVNQCLQYGGWSDVAGASSNAKSWWYKSKGAGAYPSFSKSWASAHGLYVFLTKTPTRATATRYSQLEEGDIVQVKFKGKSTIGRSMIVTGACIGANNEPFLWVTYNTAGEPWETGKKDLLLDEMFTTFAGASFYYWKMK